MATETTATVQEEEQSHNWEGGESPFKVSYGKLMMWYFLVSDAFTFSALLISYGAIRFSHAEWPNPEQVFDAFPFMGHAHVPLGFVSLMTFILIMSSVFVVRAVQEGHMMNKQGVIKWMIWGIIGGAAFLGCQAWEWTHLIHNGTTLASNPYGPAAFGQLFFLITGFHGTHVLSGVIINIVILINTIAGTYERLGHYEMVEKVGLYWHFVDLVWVFVFLAFYLL